MFLLPLTLLPHPLGLMGRGSVGVWVCWRHLVLDSYGLLVYNISSTLREVPAGRSGLWLPRSQLGWVPQRDSEHRQAGKAKALVSSEASLSPGRRESEAESAKGLSSGKMQASGRLLTHSNSLIRWPSRCVARPGLCRGPPTGLPACGLPGLRLGWEHPECAEPWGMLAHPCRPAASAGDLGEALDTGGTGALPKAFPGLGSLCRLPGNIQEAG